MDKLLRKKFKGKNEELIIPTGFHSLHWRLDSEKVSKPEDSSKFLRNINAQNDLNNARKGNSSTIKNRRRLQRNKINLRNLNTLNKKKYFNETNEPNIPLFLNSINSSKSRPINFDTLSTFRYHPLPNSKEALLNEITPKFKYNPYLFYIFSYESMFKKLECLKIDAKPSKVLA